MCAWSQWCRASIFRVTQVLEAVAGKMLCGAVEGYVYVVGFVGCGCGVCAADGGSDDVESGRVR